ncbi:MAG: hypothetical protein P8019_08820, partial [Gammaproteobacteria bacterium]
MKPTNKKTLLAFVLVPGLAYPLYAGVVFIFDSLLGDRTILRQLHEARRHLWDTFWADYAHALPVFYLIGVLVFLIPALFIQRTGRGYWLPVLLGLLVGGGLGAYVSGAIFGWTMLSHALVG